MREAILILNGPNLNSLGRREPAKYGAKSLAELEREWQSWAMSNRCRVRSLVSQFEGELLVALHAAEEEGEVGVVILNPGALTHTSRALRDAIASLSIPVIEVHLTNIAAREPWRRISVVSEVCAGSITGLGSKGYLLGLAAALDLLRGNHAGA